jgi:alkaline phosphatase
MQYEADRANDPAGEPSLTEMTVKAIETLDRNPRGYTLMVESGRIDHAHHASNAWRALTDTIELSNAVAAAAEMVDLRETMIVVTADHSHVFTISGYPTKGNDILGLVRGNLSTGAPAPNPTLASDGWPYTTLSYANGSNAGRQNLTGVDTTDPDFKQPSLVPLGSETHSGEDVPIYAIGASAHLFKGTVEQSYIGYAIIDSLRFNR